MSKSGAFDLATVVGGEIEKDNVLFTVDQVEIMVVASECMGFCCFWFSVALVVAASWFRQQTAWNLAAFVKSVICSDGCIVEATRSYENWVGVLSLLEKQPIATLGLRCNGKKKCAVIDDYVPNIQFYSLWVHGGGTNKVRMVDSREGTCGVGG